MRKSKTEQTKNAYEEKAPYNVYINVLTFFFFFLIGSLVPPPGSKFRGHKLAVQGLPVSASKIAPQKCLCCLFIITFQTANLNWEGQKPKIRRPQQGRQPSKKRENFRKKTTIKQTTTKSFIKLDKKSTKLKIYKQLRDI